MSVTRRRALALFSATLAAPYVLRAEGAKAASTLTPLGSPIFLGAGQPGGKYAVSLATFSTPGQGFIAGWINDPPGDGNAKNFIQYFNADGTPSSAPIEMSGPAGTTDGTFANGVFPIAQPDGQAIILFGAKNDASDETDMIDIFSQRMAVGHTKVGNPKLINTLRTLDQGFPMGVGLSNGKFLAAWTSQLSGPDTIDVRGRIITLDGVGTLNDRRLHKESTGEQRLRSAAALASGKSVVSYSSLDQGTLSCRAVVLNANATRARDVSFQFATQSDINLTFGAAAVVTRGPNQNKWLAIGHTIDPQTLLGKLWFREFDGITPLGPAHRIGAAFAIEDARPDEAPSVCWVGGNRFFVQHWGFTNNKKSIEGIIIDVGTKTVVAPRVVIHRTSGDTTPEAVIRIPQQQTYVCGFSDGRNTNGSTAKAILQRMTLA